jgi:hypothetical protein
VLIVLGAGNLGKSESVRLNGGAGERWGLLHFVWPQVGGHMGEAGMCQTRVPKESLLPRPAIADEQDTQPFRQARPRCVHGGLSINISEQVVHAPVGLFKESYATKSG